MYTRLCRSLFLPAAVAAILCAPVMLDGTGMPYVTGIDAVAGNGKGNGNGNSGGNGNGNGNGNSAKSSASASGSDTPGSNGGGNGKKKSSTTEVTVEAMLESGSGKKRNLNAELGRLNSLKRNINGLMNSSDPKMEGIREYIVANGTLVDAQVALETANGQLATAQANYDALAVAQGVGGYADTSPGALQARLDQITLVELPADPTNQALLDEQALLAAAIPALGASAELQALTDATTAAAGAAADVAEAEAAVSDDVLRAALLLAANPNRRSDTYLTDEIMTWASNELGVGDANGLIDDYLARR